jgi:mRNA interferase HigB
VILNTSGWSGSFAFHSRLTADFAFCEAFISVRVISRRMLLIAAGRHQDVAPALDAWYRIVKKAQWTCLADVRKDYPHADAVGRCTVFNIKGNRYRLIVAIHYDGQRIYIRHVLTHAEYDREGWKHECECD